MSQPPLTPDPGGAPSPQEPAVAGWPPPGGWATPAAQPVPDWASTTSWQPSVPAAAPVPAAPSGRGRWAVAGAALGGLAVGAVAATFLVGAVFIGSAEDIGRAMAEELTPGLTEGIRQGMADGAQDQMDAAMGMLDQSMGWYAGTPTGPVDQFPPVEPGDLGPDGALDAYAQTCFDGELQSCDDLMYESPPLSDYEEYASTCGGRVKPYAVMACTELE
ncbi:hypothetical protein ABC795_03445 [Blastococcus sp. HT6-30]|uniref:hypothetical protein n=1 Tax=Blastococcus sp. HT6-30 TaxID=3144843 RepID=UPI00321AD2F7